MNPDDGATGCGSVLAFGVKEAPGGNVALISGFGCASEVCSLETCSDNARSASAKRAGEPYFVTGVAGALGFALFGSGAAVAAAVVPGGTIALDGICMGGDAESTLSIAGVVAAEIG